jgi:trehalose/maltose hydrolase-like predicted phosphorylase
MRQAAVADPSRNPPRAIIGRFVDHQSILDHWDEISRQMYVPFHGHGIISQFDGYEQLQEMDLDVCRARYGDIRRIDRILEAENRSVNQYKISKQPDALMMFYLLSWEELERIFSGLGYPLTLNMLQSNIAYYQQRTVHGSTLSRIVFSWILARWDRKGSWQFLIEALGNDTHHITGGSTGQGIHLGAMAGTVDLIQRCYAGISIENDMLCLDPQLPESLRGVDMNMYYRHHQIHVRISQESLSIQISPGLHFPIKINVRGKIHTVDSTQRQEFAL